MNLRCRYWLPGVLTAAALFGLVIFAHAGEKAHDVKLTTEQAFVLLDVLSARMDKYDKPQVDGKPVTGFYQLDGATRMAMAKNIAALQYVTKAAEKARNDLVMQLSEGAGKLEPNSPEAAKLQAEWLKVLDRPNSMNLFFLSESELKVREKDKDGQPLNPWPPSLLAALVPILD